MFPLYNARDFPTHQFELQTEDKGPLLLQPMSLEEMRKGGFESYTTGRIKMHYCQHMHLAKRFDLSSLVNSEVELRCLNARNMSMSDTEINRLAKYSAAPEIFKRCAKSLLKDGSRYPVRCRVVDYFSATAAGMRGINQRGGSTQTGHITLELVYDEGGKPELNLLYALLHIIDPFEVVDVPEFAALFST